MKTRENESKHSNEDNKELKAHYRSMGRYLKRREKRKRRERLFK